MKKGKFIIILLITILMLFPITTYALDDVEDNEVVINEQEIENNIDNNEDEEDELEVVDVEEKEELLEENNDSVEKLDNDDNVEDTNTVLDVEVSLTPENGIPLVIIRIDESDEAIQNANDKDDEHEYGTIEDMNSSKHHTVRCVGTIEIIVPDDFTSEYDLKNSPVGEKELSYIRGRGNSTWMIAEKKPYKIKYDKKQDVLGMGKNKEWGLIANSFDPTLTHNAIASWIGEEMGMEFTPKLVPVEVIMIGSKSGTKYLGSYYLTELVDIGSNRVDINELDEDDTEDISGGYLLSIYYEDQDFKEPDNTVFETEYSHVKFINENPYFDEGELTEGQQAQQQYIRDYVNQIDELIMNNEVIDEETHNQISNLLDLKSTADFWLIQEFFVNFDGYKTSSNYLYKKEDGKLYWGPLWDFDLMLYMVEPDIPSHVMGFNQVLPFPWLDKLRSSDPYFVEIIKQEWDKMSQLLSELTSEAGVLDYYKERQREAWDKNYSVWKDSSYYGRDTSIDEEFEIIRTIIDSRRQWFIDNIDNVGKVYSTITYEVDGEIINQEVYRTDTVFMGSDLKPQKDGFLFDCWVDSETLEYVQYEKILKDLVLIPKFVAIDDVDDDISFFFSKYEDWVLIDDGEYYISVLVYPYESSDLVLNSVVYTSSNENVAIVEDEIIKLLSVGDVTITLKIFNGDSRSLLLHIFDDSYETIDEPEDFTVSDSEITIEVGELFQIITSMVPNKPVNPDRWFNVNRDVSDEEIIDVDYSDCPIIEGLKEGTATITIYLYGEIHDDYYAHKTIIVHVVSKKEETNNDNTDEEIVYNGETKKGLLIVNNLVNDNNTNEEVEKVVSDNNLDKEIEIKEDDVKTTGKTEKTCTSGLCCTSFLGLSVCVWFIIVIALSLISVFTLKSKKTND